MVVGKSSNRGTLKKKRAAGAGAKKLRAQRVKSHSRQVVVRAAKVAKPAKSSKIASMTVMLCGKRGATLAELCKMTGWQSHSVRAVISAVMKKKFGLEVVSERVDGKRVYRVIVPA